MQAFVAMPFNSSFLSVWKAIKESCEANGIRPCRVDQLPQVEDIHTTIFTEIEKSEIIIVDFTGDTVLTVPNPNVVTEATHARGLKKPIVILTQCVESLPFDWKTHRATVYQNNKPGLEYLTEVLTESLAGIKTRLDVVQEIKVEGCTFLKEMSCTTGNLSYSVSLYTHEKTGMEMVYIPAGEFRMGTEMFDGTKTVRSIYLDAYLIARGPVSNAQFAKFIQDGGYKNRNVWSEEGWEWREQEKCEKPVFWTNDRFNKADHPVVGVSWYEAQAYCKWAGLRLPTEAQWIKTARGGIWLDGDGSRKIKNPLPERTYPWGNEQPNAGNIWRANYNDTPEYGSESSSPIGKFPAGASAYGCLDMAGNVCEWCADWYDEHYYASMPDKNPPGPESGEYRVLLGGSWRLVARNLAFYRDWFAPQLRNGFCGFRAAGLLTP